MANRNRSASTGDESLSGEERSVRERDRRLGLFVVEVARATHEGRLPISQTEIRRALKRNFRLDLAPSAIHLLSSTLKHEFRNKVWIKVEGHQVTLFSEDETLVDSRAVRSLLLARNHLNDDGSITVEEWKDLCDSELNLSSEACDELFLDIVECGYSNGENRKGVLELNVRAIGEDEFYLQQAAKANLRKSVARTRPARQ